MEQNLLESYTQMLLNWNQIHSLSGAKDKDSIAKNIQNALYPLSFLDLSQKTLLLDVGSGNGFPAIPLHITLKIPTLLCEPNAKKAAFLQNIKANLNLNCTIHRQKVESLQLITKPDIITSRATFSTPLFLEKCKHLIAPNALILLYKGSKLQDEIPKNLKCKCFTHGLLQYLVIYGKDILC